MRTSHPLGKVLPLAATLAIALILSPAPIRAAKLKQARVSQVVKDVKLLPGQAAPRPASVRDEVRDGTAVRTGIESRAELMFTDATLARLGANTIFSFDQGTRNLELGGGAMLLRVPKDSGGAKINTAAITAAITGTTIMLEYHPDAYVKFIVLEGTGRIYRNNRVGESVLLHAGQMLIVNPNGDGLPDPVDVDLERLMETSLLIKGFRTLPSNDLIAREINGQLSRKSEGELIETNLVIFGRGTAVTLLDPTMTDILDQANANDARQPSSEPTVTPTIAPPTPTPGKFGALNVISSPAPYVLKSSTLIQTDPRITTDGRTDFGRIYRGPELDGAAAQYLFGSTSQFDLDSGFNEHFGSAQNEPMAAFKFSSLILAGNPTISLANGGATKLALISVGNIATGTAPATFTYDGIDSLLLATQNGSITIGANITFQNIPTLFLYARGAASVLTFDAAVNGTSILSLFAEGNIKATNSLTVNESGAGLSEGLIISLFAGQAINIGQDLTLSIATGDEVPNGALINLESGTDINVSGAMDLTIDSSGGGHLGGDAVLGIFGGGDLIASSLNLLINNRNSGTIDGGATLSIDVGGAITISGDAIIAISNRDDLGGPGTMGGPANLSLNAGSIFIGGLLDTGITPPLEGGTIPSVTMTYNVNGDFTVAGSAEFELANGGSSPLGFFGGGIISGDALVSLNAGSLSVGDFFNVFLINIGGGQIGGDAIMSISTTDSLAATGQTIFQLANGGAQTVRSGTIDGSALLSVNAGSITIGDFFAVEINNESGGIGNDAILSVAAGDITIAGDALIDLLNGQSFDGPGTIGGDASISITGGNFSANSVLVQIDNNEGTIGGQSSLLFQFNDTITTTVGDATFEIRSPAGLVQTGSVTIIGGSFDIAGSLFARISAGESFLSPETVGVSSSGDITVGGVISVAGSVFAIGNISAVDGISIFGGSLTADGDIISTAGPISLNEVDGLSGNISAEGDISAAGGIFTPGDPTTVAAGGAITAPGIITGTLNASGNITIDNTAGTFDFGIIANSITSGGNLRLLNSPSISPNNASSNGNIGFTFDDFFLAVASIVSTGPTIPVLSSNGYDTDPNVANGNPGNGGNITLNLAVGGLNIGSAGDLARIEANGGAFANGAILGGNGGVIDITATEDVNVNGNISASTGVNPTGTPAGNGGTVSITTAGTITVSSKIEASSNDQFDISPPPPERHSAKGGNITLTSNKAAGVAINVSNTGQLLALLDNAAPGPGGKITILATGASSSVVVNGRVQADKGTVDIRHTGANGIVNLGDATGTSFVTLNGDIVKAGALGANGVLNIGQGSLSADSVLKLYAPASNGTLNFVANVTISSGTDAILAANTITIQPTVVVNVQGNGGPAQVFTNNPNYSGFGGNNSRNGTFGGNGANNPLPLNQAPPFDGPPGG